MTPEQAQQLLLSVANIETLQNQFLPWAGMIQLLTLLTLGCFISCTVLITLQCIHLFRR